MTFAPPVRSDTTSDDRKLLKAIIANDPAALTTLYDRYVPLCYTIVSRIVKEEPPTADILQRTFLYVWQNADSCAESRSVGGWLVSLARAEALQWLRDKPQGVLPPAKRGAASIVGLPPTQLLLQ